MDISLWDDASRDFEEEQAVRRLHAAKARVGGLWAFLSNAKSVEEFNQRRELAIEAISQAVYAVAEDERDAEDTFQRLTASLDEDFAIVMEARRLVHEKTAGSHEPLAYVYDADLHCPGCAEERFGRDKHGFIAGEGSHDSEGNPVGVLAPWDETSPHGEHCGTCHGQIASAYDHDPDTCEYAGDCTGKVDEHGRALYRNPRNKKDADPDQGAFDFGDHTASRLDFSKQAGVPGYYNPDHTPHAQHCSQCGTHFDGKGFNVNFTPGPGGQEWNHCPTCGASAQHGAVQNCGPECREEHREGIEHDEDPDDGYSDDYPDYHGLDGDNYGDPYGKMDRYHEFKNSSLHIFRVAAEGGDAYIIVDEESGYKVGGPYASRSDAEAAIASGKFNGKHVKIERAGEEETEKREEHPGGRGAHDSAGGTKPVDDKGHHRKNRQASRLPFAVAAEDTNPFMDGGNPYMGDDSTGGTSAGGGSGNGLDGPPQAAPEPDYIPISTKPRQMPGGESDQMGMGQDMGVDQDGDGDADGPSNSDDGQVGNNSGAVSGGGANQMGGA